MKTEEEIQISSWEGRLSCLASSSPQPAAPAMLRRTGYLGCRTEASGRLRAGGRVEEHHKWAAGH